MAGKAYYLLTVFGDRILKRGAQKRNLLLFGAAVVVVFWVYSSLLYLDAIYFPFPLPRWYGGPDWMLNSGLPLGLTRSTGSDVAAVAIFVTYPIWFYIGTELAFAGHRLTKGQRLRERNMIIKQLVSTVFPKGGAIAPGAADVDTRALVESLLEKIPLLFSDSLTLLLFVFDSRFLVLAFTGRWTRFVNLDASPDSDWEKRKYLQAWDSNMFLASVTAILRITASYGYYTRPAVYKTFNYDGPQVPNLPPWYDPGPASPSTRTGT